MRVGTVLIRQIESENRSNHQVGENEQNVKQLLHKIHTPSRPSLEWQGKLGEAQSAGRDCPGSGAAGPLAAMAWTEIPATAGYTALCLPLLPGVSPIDNRRSFFVTKPGGVKSSLAIGCQYLFYHRLIFRRSCRAVRQRNRHISDRKLI